MQVRGMNEPDHQRPLPWTRHAKRTSTSCLIVSVGESILNQGTFTISRHRVLMTAPMTGPAFQRCVDPTCATTIDVADTTFACPRCGGLVDVAYDWHQLPIPSSFRDFEAKWSQRTNPLSF